MGEEWRASLLTSVGLLLSAMIAIDAGVVGAELARQLDFVSALTIVVIMGVYFVGFIYIRHLRPYQKRIRELDALFKKLYDGEPIGNVADILKKK